MAWNGGGNTNYSDIIGKGDYVVKSEQDEKEQEEEQTFTILPVEEVKITITNAGAAFRVGTVMVEEKLEELVGDVKVIIGEIDGIVNVM